MIEIRENLCDFCGACVSVCPVDAMELKETQLSIDPHTCTDCELCVWVCPIGVLKKVESSEVPHA